MDDREKKMNTAYDRDSVAALAHYAESSHQICRTVIRAGMWVFFMLPVLLLVMMKLAGTDKVVILLTWIIGMFALTVIIIIVGYFDRRLQNTLDKVYGEGSVQLPALIEVEPGPIVRMVKQTEEMAREVLTKEVRNEQNPKT